MKQYVALLRGINVGGHRKIKMADLRHLCEKIGFETVQSYIQSGNLVFQSNEDQAPVLAKVLQQAILDHHGFEVLTFVISREDFLAAIEANPFGEREDPDPKKLHLCFLHEAVDTAKEAELQAVESGRDEVRLHPKVLYLYCPDGFGRTKYTDSLIKRILQTKGTTRNWRTVGKLQEMLN
ncbi:MAG: DUF1697 domain-containing protein [Bacteroidota bacterium]